MGIGKEKKMQMEQELYEVICKLKTPKDVENFFSDLLTIPEIERISQRVLAARLFMEGKTYQQIIDQTDISSATLSRVSHCVNYGSGGYNTFIVPKKED